MNETNCLAPEGMTESDSPNNISVRLMLDSTPYKSKPSGKQIGAISNSLKNGATDILVEELALNVGTEGCSFIPALLDGMGCSAENWASQQVFGLDFDKDITIAEFGQRCDHLQLHPAFTYKTFSHAEHEEKFRAVFVLEHVVTDERLRKLVVMLFMKLFPKCDGSCKNASRIFFGGKGLLKTNFHSTINAIQLLDTWMLDEENRSPKNFSRSRSNFLKKVDVYFGPEGFGIQKKDYIDPEIEGNRFCSLTNKEEYQQSSISRITYDGEIYEISWVEKEQKDCIGTIPTKSPIPAVTSEKATEPKLNLSADDVARLDERCRLFREFHQGERRLGKRQRRIVLSNLRWFRNGMTIYREGLAHFDSNSTHPDPYSLDDRNLVSCAERYNFNPEGCSNCPYHTECNHHTNLIQQIRLRKGACRIVDTPTPRVSLDVARIEVKDSLDQILIQNAAVNDFSIVRADCGVGKTEAVLNLLPQLDGVGVAFPTHKLAQEAFERYLSLGTGVSYFLWPERPALPESFQRELEWQDRIGLPRAQEVYEAALESREVQASSEWVCAIEGYLEAYRGIHGQSRIFCTHEKAVRLMNGGNSRIKTWIFDEDPMQCLFKIGQIALTDIESTIGQFKNAPGVPQKVVELLENVRDCECNILKIPDDTSVPYGSLDSFLAKNDISTPVLSLLDCTGYIKPQWKEEQEAKDIYCITHRSLPSNCKFIILSATPIVPLYEKAYGERAKLWNISPVKSQGRLVLHRGRSFSKRGIADLGKSFITMVEEFVESYRLDGLITYKDWAKSNHSRSILKGSEKEIPVFSTFGATEGFNTASGKNIGVIGTPRLPQHALMLLAHAAGERVNPGEFELKCRTIRRHEFEVSLHCVSDDAFIQAMEFAVVERELIQAVGRARLLENECEVHLFSNYVLSGGELWKKVG